MKAILIQEKGSAGMGSIRKTGGETKKAPGSHGDLGGVQVQRGAMSPGRSRSSQTCKSRWRKERLWGRKGLSVWAGTNRTGKRGCYPGQIVCHSPHLLQLANECSSELGRAEPTLQGKEKPNPGEDTAPRCPERPRDTGEGHLHEYLKLPGTQSHRTIEAGIA